MSKSDRNDKTKWLRRLAGEVVTIHDDLSPDYGFYRVRNREGSFDTVAYWYSDDGEVRCKRNGKPVDEQIACELWPRASESAITYELYNAVCAGEPWPDLSEVVTRLNNAPADDSFEGIQAQIDALESEANRLIKAGGAQDENTAHVAGDLADRLLNLWKKAEAARKAEKQPHIDAGSDVDNKWRPLLTAAKIYDRLKAVVCDPWLKAEKAKQEREAAEARRIADEAARAAREAAANAEREGNERAAAEARKAEETAAEAAQKVETIANTRITAGTRGRAVHLRSYTKVSIEDRAAMLAFFADRQEITDVLQDMAEKAVKAGIKVPGAKVEKGSKAA